MATTAKRVRPRPNIVQVDMDKNHRSMIDEIIAYEEKITMERISAAGLIRRLVRNQWEATKVMQGKKKSLRNSKN